MYRAFASLSYSNLITSLCALLEGQDATTDTMRTSPALASVYMTSSLRPSSARPVCTRLFGLKCIGGRLFRTLRMSATVVLLAEVLYLVRRARPDVLTDALRKVVNHALEFRLS